MSNRYGTGPFNQGDRGPFGCGSGPIGPCDNKPVFEEPVARGCGRGRGRRNDCCDLGIGLLLGILVGNVCDFGSHHGHKHGPGHDC